MGIANNQFYFTGVQVEKGTIMTGFESRPAGLELLLCQRYYEIIYSNITLYASTANVFGHSAPYSAAKRVSPTFNIIRTGETINASSGYIADGTTGHVSYPAGLYYDTGVFATSVGSIVRMHRIYNAIAEL